MRICVIKIGTASVCSSTIVEMAKVSQGLLRMGIHPIIVSSGAVGFGKEIIKFDTLTLARKQALASIGQPRVMQLYASIFAEHDLHVGELLLGRGIIENRDHYANAQNTLNELLTMGVVPIINENDAVFADELKFGDNDRLSAFVAEMVNAKSLVIVTDVDGLYDRNPSHPGAKLIKRVESIEQLQIKGLDNTGSESSTGGMLTKLVAAHYATAADIDTWIIHAKHPGRILDIFNKKAVVGTQFCGHKQCSSREWWITNGLMTKGQLHLSEAAIEALENLQPIYLNQILNISGDFQQKHALELCDEEGHPLGKGISNFTSTELTLLTQDKNCIVMNVDNIAMYE